MTPQQLRAFVTRDHAQERSWSCGAAALATALSALGFTLTEQQTRILTQTSWNGVDGDQLVWAITALGLHPEVIHSSDRDGVWKRLVDFLRRGIPCILCVDEWEHWIAATGVDIEHVVIVDPSDGDKDVLTRGELVARWENPDVERAFYAIAVHR